MVCLFFFKVFILKKIVFKYIINVDTFKGIKDIYG